MSKSLVLAFFLFSLSQLTDAAIFKSDNSKLNCSNYQIINKVRTQNGDNEYSRELENGEEVITDRTIYGLGLKNIKIDFDKRNASFDLIKHVSLGFNRPLFVTGARVSIDSSNKAFSKVINLTNKKITLIQSICITDQMEIINLRLN
jgi:hypothetical protein